MRQDELQNRIEQYLGSYKRETLGLEGEGLEVPLEKNFIETSYELLQKYYNKDSIEDYGKNLKSEKVMGMNLFLPLVEKEELLKSVLASMLEVDEKNLGDVEELEFDKVINNDVNNDMDLYIKLSTGERIFIEFTYWQDNFGSFIGENNQIMWDEELSKQAEKSLYLKDITREEFCKNFRLNRNISLMEGEKDYLVFVYPFENDALKERMKDFNYKNLMEVDLHELPYFILKSGLSYEEEEYFKEFTRKYLIY